MPSVIRPKHEKRWPSDALAYVDGLDFSYCKLPQQLFKLSIPKLDGSSFDVQGSRTATVGELRLAVEGVFERRPRYGEGEISWNHVWGHFCLCYGSHNLLDDKDCLQTFGIKDVDQLLFKRHLSVNYNPEKRHGKSRKIWVQKMSTRSDMPGESSEGEEGVFEVDNRQAYKNYNKGNAIIRNGEIKFIHLWKGWLSFSRIWCRRRKRLRESGTVLTLQR